MVVKGEKGKGKGGGGRDDNRDNRQQADHRERSWDRRRR